MRSKTGYQGTFLVCEKQGLPLAIPSEHIDRLCLAAELDKKNTITLKPFKLLKLCRTAEEKPKEKAVLFRNGNETTESKKRVLIIDEPREFITVTEQQIFRLPALILLTLSHSFFSHIILHQNMIYFILNLDNLNETEELS
ncbi:MAG: hypothetical protein PF495_04285 [Spirochaetales bacterium]|jgi:hypothetical protein|nr:hypothetical protein [Spirochaetales bacterium]